MTATDVVVKGAGFDACGIYKCSHRVADSHAVGTEVEADGLVGSAELNGRRGRVTQGIGGADVPEGYVIVDFGGEHGERACLLYTSPSPRDKRQSRMPSSA